MTPNRESLMYIRVVVYTGNVKGFEQKNELTAFFDAILMLRNDTCAHDAAGVQQVTS